MWHYCGVSTLVIERNHDRATVLLSTDLDRLLLDRGSLHGGHVSPAISSPRLRDVKHGDKRNNDASIGRELTSHHPRS